MVRASTLDDLPDLLRMAEEFYSSKWRDNLYDAEATENVIRFLIENGVVLRSEQGMLGGALLPVWCSPLKVVAVEMFWWSKDNTGTLLLAHFLDWARSKGAPPRVCSMGGESPAMSRKLGPFGLVPFETVYAPAEETCP